MRKCWTKCILLSREGQLSSFLDYVYLVLRSLWIQEDYAVALFFVGIASTAVGQVVVNHLVKKVGHCTDAFSKPKTLHQERVAVPCNSPIGHTFRRRFRFNRTPSSPDGCAHVFDFLVWPVRDLYNVFTRRLTWLWLRWVEVDPTGCRVFCGSAFFLYVWEVVPGSLHDLGITMNCKTWRNGRMKHKEPDQHFMTPVFVNLPSTRVLCAILLQYKRTSFIILSIGSVVALSAIMMGSHSIYNFLVPQTDVEETGGFCSVGE